MQLEEEKERGTEERGRLLVETTNLSRLPDLVSDSLVECRRPYLSSTTLSSSSSESASTNPFVCTPPQSGLSWQVHQEEEEETVAVHEPLIFNFDSVVGVKVQPATGAVYSVGDLISLDMDGVGVSSVGECGSDENVVNALRDAEGSIRKLELASRHEDAEVDDQQQQLKDTDRRHWVSTAENGLAGKNFLINSGWDTDPYTSNNSNTRMTKYEDSFTSDSHEELQMLMNCQRRYRSHSETEATIFDRLLNQQQRRMMLSSNNPFLSPDLLQPHESHSSSSSTQQQQTRGQQMMPRSNGMMLKQRENECTNNNINKTGPPVQDSNPQTNNNNNNHKPILRTVSETYLGQFRATSALPRSSSILQLLEQQHNHYGPPPLSPTLPFVESNGGAGRGRAVAGKERNGNSNNNRAGWGKHSTSNAIGKVTVFGDSSTQLFKRTLSSESVSSQSSVLIADLEPSSATAGHNPVSGGSAEGPPPITGYLCVGLQYDK